jgi:inosose dehydratase
MSNRRTFIHQLAGAGGAVLLPNFHGTATEKDEMARPPFPISCNQYVWFTFFGREGREWGKDLDASLGEYAKTGLKAFEPSFESAQQVAFASPLLRKHGISIPSVYVNSVLHRADEAKNSRRTILEIADALVSLGTKIIVTNPTPIKWGGTEDKTDAALRFQALQLDQLGAALRKRGMMLAYHNHDVELRAGAREFHHMLQATSPKNVKFCFDIHWLYRGSGNSDVAVWNTLQQYADRTVELHLRQSVNGVWSETFGEGDINLRALFDGLKLRKMRPHLVLEQCCESATPHTLGPVEATIKSWEYLRGMLA